MPKHTKIKDRIAAFAEINNIISAMKNLSLIETSRTTKYLATQSQFLAMIQNIAADFCQFHYPTKIPLTAQQPELYILLGSERGFCGNFNELIVERWRQNCSLGVNQGAKIMVIGSKLATKVPANLAATKFNGANVATEISAAVFKLMTELEHHSNPENWVIIWNEITGESLTTKMMRPVADFGISASEATRKFTTPPWLYLQPEVLLLELLNQYLFAIFHQIFYQSFLTENKQRSKHMDAALDWLEQKNGNLRLQLNQLRQEEITEEIEVVMLNR